jgi:DNA primase
MPAGAERITTMRLLHKTLPDHGKRRRNDYLSLMYLMMLAGSDEAEVAAGLQELSPSFIGQIRSINDTSRETARESNPIATALASLFTGYRNAVDLDEKARYSDGDRANHLAAFIERYQVRFEDLNTMEPVSAGRLLTALRRVGREFNLEFEYKKPAQLGRRISNDLQVIREAGFNISRERNAHTKNFEYRIRKVSGAE